MAKPGLHLIIKCLVCKQDFRQSRSDQRFCGIKCCTKAWRDARSKKESRMCDFCGNRFIAVGVSHKYCSKQCSNKARLKKDCKGLGKSWSLGKRYTQRSICEECGKEFYCAPCVRARSSNSGRFCSKLCRGANASKNVDLLPKYSRGVSGYRDDLQRKYFRSSWEANWARYLNYLKMTGEIRLWLHEPLSFKISINGTSCHYVPDFKVVYTSGKVEFHEVKGYMDQRSKTKIEAFVNQYPKINLKVIDSKEYRSVEKKVKNMIMFWEKAAKLHNID